MMKDHINNDFVTLSMTSLQIKEKGKPLVDHVRNKDIAMMLALGSDL